MLSKMKRGSELSRRVDADDDDAATDDDVDDDDADDDDDDAHGLEPD